VTGGDSGGDGAGAGDGEPGDEGHSDRGLAEPAGVEAPDVGEPHNTGRTGSSPGALAEACIRPCTSDAEGTSTGEAPASTYTGDTTAEGHRLGVR
jgi:hypothetical protein